MDTTTTATQKKSGCLPVMLGILIAVAIVSTLVVVIETGRRTHIDASGGVTTATATGDIEYVAGKYGRTNRSPKYIPTFTYEVAGVEYTLRGHSHRSEDAAKRYLLFCADEDELLAHYDRDNPSNAYLTGQCRDYLD